MKDRINQEEFSQLPQWAQGAYKKDESQGDFAFGFVPKGRLDEFRANNTGLLKEQDRLKAELQAFEGINPTEAKAALSNKDQSEKTGNQALEGLKNQYQTLEQKAQAEKTGLMNQLKELKVRQSLISALNQVGGYQEGALDLLVEQGSKLYQLDDQGAVRPVGPNGETVFHGAEPLGMTDWVKQVQENQPFLFKQSTGGGAQGSGTHTSPMGALNPSQYDGTVVPKDTLEKLATGL